MAQTAGYAPRYTPSRSGQIRKHHAFTMDASINKSFFITERIRAQFRMEAFNLLNHNFYGRNDGFNTDPNNPRSARCSRTRPLTRTERRATFSSASRSTGKQLNARIGQGPPARAALAVYGVSMKASTSISTRSLGSTRAEIWIMVAAGRTAPSASK